MRAVNLIPGDTRRSSGGSRFSFGPTQIVLAVLAVAVGLVTVYVLTNNTIKERQVKLAQLSQEVSQQQAEATRLEKYASFVKLAEKRVETVRQIASTRFDWHGSLGDLSRVVPANTSLSSLTASVAPGSSTGTGATPGSTSVRGDVTSPAFEIKGCTKNQDDVARLMSRLRLMNGVTRVTLEDSQKPGGASGGASVSSAPSAVANGAQGCGNNTPTFDLVVFFAALPGEEQAAGAVTTSTPTPAPTSTTSSTSSTTSTTTSAGSTQ